MQTDRQTAFQYILRKPGVLRLAHAWLIMGMRQATAVVNIRLIVEPLLMIEHNMTGCMQ